MSQPSRFSRPQFDPDPVPVPVPDIGPSGNGIDSNLLVSPIRERWTNIFFGNEGVRLALLPQNDKVCVTGGSVARRSNQDSSARNVS